MVRLMHPPAPAPIRSAQASAKVDPLAGGASSKPGSKLSVLGDRPGASTGAPAVAGGGASLGLLAALALAVYLWRASPQASGSQQVVGVTAAITIERDAMGVGVAPDAPIGSRQRVAKVELVAT
jgi:hypothetical protein